MVLPFQIEFTIFDPRERLTHRQIDLKRKLLKVDLHNIVQDVVGKLDSTKFKYIRRYEATIASLDENKQLRSYYQTNLKHMGLRDHCIYFHQFQSNGTFLNDELLEVSRALKYGLEGYLEYKIDDPRVFVTLSDIEDCIKQQQ